MSKKTKRLEKENLSLTRKHEATNQSIIKMAEERTRAHKEMAKLIKKNENLEKLCRGMQAQGRGLAPAGGAGHGGHEDAASASEYDEDGVTGGGTFEIHDDCPIHGTRHVHDHTCLEDSHGEEDGDDEFEDGEEEDERGAPQDDEAEDSDVLPSADRAASPPVRQAPVGKILQLSNGTAAAGAGARKGGRRGTAVPTSRAAGANGVKR